VLININNIAPFFVDKSGYRTDDSRLVGAINEDGCLQSVIVLGRKIRILGMKYSG
jgi:hypothetical protein